MSGAPELVLLTAAFPYGDKSETFLETEIRVLARRFSRIRVLPSHRREGIRPLPANVELVEMEWLEGWTSSDRIRALASARAMGVLVQSLRRPRNWGAYLGTGRKLYLDLLARNLLKARALERWVRREGLRDALFYDYWFENSTLALALLRRSGAVDAAVARGHAFDVYDDRWDDGVVPFREAKVRGLDRVYLVSRHGLEYMRERLSADVAARLRLARLGVPRQRVSDAPPGPTPLVVSCSSMLPRKRVHVLPRVLGRVERPLRWIHFGDGPERERVEREAAALPDRVEWELRGHVPNPELLDFYRENRVDLLLSVSVAEGLPVSMMEAISFGVPVVGLAVQGTPEIVTDATGILLDEDADEDAVARAVERALEPGRFDRDRIRAFFRSRFDAETNYDEFADALIAIWQDQAPAA